MIRVSISTQTRRVAGGHRLSAPAEQSSAAGHLNRRISPQPPASLAPAAQAPGSHDRTSGADSARSEPSISFAKSSDGTGRLRLPSSIRNELKSVETEIKYEGYLLQQQRAIDRLKKSEQRNIPEWFDYKSVSGLSREMQETLMKIRPRTLGHASRIPGVTPAAVSLVNVYIEIQGKRRELAATL